MTDESIRAVIVERLTEAQACQETGHRHFLLGVIRGLLWCLNGVDPGTGTLRNANLILTAAGVPYTRDGGEVIIPNEWLVGHGLEPSVE